ncbi:MAG: type II secretion system protein GspG, partial [Abditibacteriaceae bacterium]
MASIEASYFKVVKFKQSWILVASALLIVSLFSRSAMADKIAPSSNAYDYYAKAAAALPKNPPKSTFPDFDDGSPDKIAPYHSALERNEAVLKANAQTLKLLREGFAFEYRRSAKLGSDEESFSLAIQRQIARVLMLASKVMADQGDWAGAANSAVDGIRFGQDVSHGLIINMLNGSGVQSVVRKSLYETLSHVNAATANSIAKRLEKILSQKILYANLLNAEKNYSLPVFDEIVKDPNWQHYYSTQEDIDKLKRTYAKAMDGLIANAQLPYPERKGFIDKPTDPLNMQLLDLYTNTQIKSGITQGLSHATQRTQNLFVMVEFALRAYFLEHGKYPETLTALTPDYLQNLPDDPFAANQPLRYKTNNKAYTLYSIGPDGKDDGGKPIKE